MIKLYLLDGAKVPTRGSRYSVGLDLYSVEGVLIKSGQRAKVRLGIKSSMGSEFLNQYIEFREKSGMALQGVGIHGGIIDYDYRGEWAAVVSYNQPDDNLFEQQQKEYWIYSGDKVCQMIMHPDPWKEVIRVYREDELDRVISSRGEGGFGSTS